MNRALFIALCLVVAACCIAGPIINPYRFSSGGLTEQVWQSNSAGTEDAAFLSTASAVTQRIKGIQAGTITITKLDCVVLNHFTDGNVTVELRANADGTGTLYGTSDALSVTAIGAKTFVFPSASVPASTDFYLWFVPGTAEDTLRIRYVDQYRAGEGYDVIVNGSSTPGGVIQDMEFTLYAMLP